MRSFKKGLGIVLALVIALTALYPALQHVAAAEFILEPSALNGRDYTSSDRMAAVLDQIFAGDIDVYSDNRYTNEVSMPVGTSMCNDTLYYVKSHTTGNPVSGWQCYIYGNAVYNKLFREWVGHADGFAHSRVVIPGGSNSVSYELLRDAGVRCGAYLRTTGNSDGSYSGGVGHSMIILEYNSKTITYLEGNGDGKGLVRVAIRTWSDFNLRQLSGRGRYISHMVQPTDAFYQAQYPDCRHETYGSNGICTDCGYEYDWQSTLDPGSKGIYRLTEKVIPRLDAPYSAAAAASVVLEKDQKISTTGQYRNALDQLWYSATDEAGNAFFVNATSLKFVGYPALEVSCTGFYPANGAVLEQKSYPVKGTVTSNFPLQSVSGYLDGELYATWTATDEATTQLELRQTDINNKLTFSKMEGGRHTIRIEAQSFVHTQTVIVHESEFFTVSSQPCSHSYVSSVTLDATCTETGVLTYTCTKCQDQYTREITAHGHDYQDDVCRYCAEQRALTNLSGTLRSGGLQNLPVKITLTGNGGAVYTATSSSASYTIGDILPDAYTMTAAKDDCVTLTTELTLEPGDINCDLKLAVPGDVNADKSLNIGDVGKIYSHLRGNQKLQDAYALLCADYNVDGTVNIGDVGKLYSFLRKK